MKKILLSFMISFLFFAFFTPYGAKAAENYEVYANGEKQARFSTFENAKAFAEGLKVAYIKHKSGSRWIWDSSKPFETVTPGGSAISFREFYEAANYARGADGAHIRYKKNDSVIWRGEILPDRARVQGVPLIAQRPELPRGCEMTSLAALINYNGERADKMKLAEAVAKDDAPLMFKRGKLTWGDPNVGFVGDMYDMSKNGYGVHHKPVYDILLEYFPRRALDLTGCLFEDALEFVADGCPVWVITNAAYDRVPMTEFSCWSSPSGEIRTTFREHSVVITGYDLENVYFNDPLEAAESAPFEEFRAAWEQMGRQALTVTR
ncbi:MAG: C39 family peptidase [Clostridiales bacterium]|jgi:uncharacterized protein YvpB|nr:C39 family peptidase [Clostridiales bacterium]